MKNFDKEKLQKCSTKKQIEQYFKSIGLKKNEYQKKIEYLTEASNSESIKFFDDSMSLDKKYNDIVVVFTDKYFRASRGFDL